jgi:predicted nuclease of restriction endonuclease-like (RecB) superfamily
LKTNLAIGQSVTDKLQLIDNQTSKKGQSVTDKFVMPMMQEKNNSILVDSSNLFNKLSFTHLVSLIPINDPLKRAFYETMAINGTWSVRELQRQIDSNYYERSGWSKRPEELARMVQGNAEIATLAMDIKSPFVFEFLGLQAKDVIEESDLESALIDNLQEFILELGMGFCFEERQKKLLIDDRYYKADLVFYHRILKRHVIIELKAHRLDYADVAQLNMYLAYYRKNIMLTDDNEPIGILLCSEVGQEMAEYTMMGADANLFLSKYQLELPSTEHFTEFLRKEHEGLNKDINNHH